MTVPGEIRKCADCGALISSGGNGRRRYCPDKPCKDRAHRKRLREAAAAAGVPVRANLAYLTTSTGGRRSNAQNARKAPKRRAPSLRVSYLKAADAVTEEIARQWLLDPARVRKRVETALKPLLSPAAREHLERGA